MLGSRFLNTREVTRACSTDQTIRAGAEVKRHVANTPARIYEISDRRVVRRGGRYHRIVRIVSQGMLRCKT
jgi:hypothetical protein